MDDVAFDAPGRMAGGEHLTKCAEDHLRGIRGHARLIVGADQFIRTAAQMHAAGRVDIGELAGLIGLVARILRYFFSSGLGEQLFGLIFTQ